MLSNKKIKINSMAKRSIALNLRGLNYSNLNSFTAKIYDGFVAEAATYPSPVVSLANQLAANNALNDALNVWGDTGHRGSRLNHEALKKAVDDVRQNLKSLAGYSMGVMPNNVLSWSEVG